MIADSRGLTVSSSHASAAAIADNSLVLLDPISVVAEGGPASAWTEVTGPYS